MKRGDKERKDMKKFTLKGVLDGFRSSVPQQTRPDQEIQETLRAENFEVKKTFRHGFPFQPTAIAFDPVQRLLAIGSKSGSLRILGRPGVDVHSTHEVQIMPTAHGSTGAGAAEGLVPGTISCGAVLQIEFLVNEGALVAATADDSLHLWNFRQKVPQVVQSLKFQRERITCLFLALQSKWLYVGTERGNIHVVNIESFVLSGYIINWNKAIEVSRKTHPGPVVHLSDNPTDANKLLIGYETGQLVMWDLKTKAAEWRWQSTEPLRSVAWHYEGKQFMCSHSDGSLTTWTLRQPKPINVSFPHAKATKDGKLEQCKSIQKVEWKSSKVGEAYVIFSGGMAYDKAGRTPSITVMHSKTTTVLEMEHNVVDFITLCESPYVSDLQEPYAIVVLLQNDLVIIDLQTAGFPCIENPYPMDLHESAVTCCSYLADCPADLIPAFYSVGTHNRAGFSKREWPINGGEWSPQSCSYSEIIMTGHADGSIKFWDASAGTLQILYKLKTAKVFDKLRAQSMDGENDDPFAIQLIYLCPESRKLCIAGGAAHVILFKFKKQETVAETACLEIPIVYDVEEGDCSPECDFLPANLLGTKTDSSDSDEKKSNAPILKVRQGPQKKPSGFQAQLVCLTPCHQGQAPGHITALGLNSSYGLMAYGNECGIVIVDIVQKVCLLNIGTPDLYGSQDPYSRVPRSPKKSGTNDGNLTADREQPQARSPSIDQVLRLSTTPVEGSFYPTSPCPPLMETTPNDPSELPAEAPVPVEEIPQQCARRKSAVNWKGFSIKRRLSKVDLKLKNTFSVPPERDKGKEQRSGSVFYCSDYDENIVIQPTCLSPVDATEDEPEEEIAEDAVQNIINELTDEVKNVSFDENEPVECTNEKRSETLESVEVQKASRPDNLELINETDRPVPPLRQKSKRASFEVAQKRDQRLLSVPNIKYNKQEQFPACSRDLRHRDRVLESQPSFAGNIMRRFNKLDSSFSRSRSSSMSSLENITSEAIQCIAFADSYSKKSEPNILVPTLWIGTSLGSVLTVLLAPPDAECRSSQPCFVSPCGGPMFRLKGSVITLSFLDCNGALIPYSFEPWRDENKDKRDRTPTKINSSKMSPTMQESKLSTTSDTFNDRQFVVISTEKQARVVALPSQTCMYRQQICDSDFVVKSDVISMKDSVCLVCYLSSGKLTTYSLPSLRPLIDIDFLPLADLRIARTFCFSNRGHGLYLSSPSEIQKFTLCAEFCQSVSEMIGDLFLALDMPEAPKESFFRGWFGAAARPLDRDELFGESSGKASKAVAKHIPGPNAQIQEMGTRVTNVTSEVGRAHQLMLERGDKLSQLEERTQRMMNEAETFSGTAHQLMNKYKDKKWYQL